MSKPGLLLLCLVLLGLAIAVVAVGAPALRAVRGASAEVPVFELRRADFVREIHADGNLRAAEATSLGPPARSRGPSRVAWLAEDGANVREGDVVIRFDPTEMEDELEDGRSERARVDARIDKQSVIEQTASLNLARDARVAELELQHAREFQSKDANVYSRIEIIESDIDETLARERKDHADDLRGMRDELARVELDLLGIERQKAELRIEQAREGLDELEVRAPHDGIFTLKEMWGRLPEVGMMAWGGNPLAEIPQLDVMEAEVFVLEADAGGLEPGLPATITLEAHPDRQYAATIAKVDALAKRRFRQAPVQYFSVVLELERTDPDVMKPGQRVRATLRLGERADALTVPRQAVFERDGHPVVYVRSGGTFEPREVETGPASLGRIVIESGLEEGQAVALRDPTRPGFQPSSPGESDSGPVPASGAAS